MDRRSLLKSAAVLPAVAALPATTVAVAEDVATDQIVPVKLTPYRDYVWRWFVSHDGEVYYDSFPTEEAALEYAKRSGYSIVAECLQQDFNLEIDSDWLIERLNYNNEEMIGEGDGIQATHKQKADLEGMVKRAIEAWVVKHDINITAWAFGDVRNETEVQSGIAIS